VDTLTAARELAAIAQTGAHFATDKYDQERYRRVREIAAMLLAAHSDVPSETIHAWSKEEFGYATPKIDVRAFIVDADRVLLIREDADEGRWTLPGGWADVNESPSESVIREVEEESGYVVRPLRLLAVFDREKQGHTPPFPCHVYKLFFHCEIIGGSAQRTAESSESAFFTEASLPALSLSRVLPSQIKGFFEALRSGNTETQYD
jgi:ADP-ribose pyrophosphatase YjhB (NUDIX family)